MKQTVEEANKLDEVLKFIYDTKVRQTTLDRHDIETVHLPSLIHKINELRAASLPTNSVQWVDARKVITDRISHFQSIYHAHEAGRLTLALNSIDELIPPSNWEVIENKESNKPLIDFIQRKYDDSLRRLSVAQYGKNDMLEEVCENECDIYFKIIEELKRNLPSAPTEPTPDNSHK